MTRSPWHHEPRIKLTEQKTAKLFLERGGRCCQCKRKLGPSDDYIVEHKIALENGGDNSWHNLDITGTKCCKARKDAKDHAEAAKSRKAVTRHVVSKSMRQKSGLSKRQGYKFNWRQGRYEKEAD